MPLGPQEGRASSILTIIGHIVGVHVFLHFLVRFLLNDHFSWGETADGDLEPGAVGAAAPPDLQQLRPGAPPDSGGAYVLQEVLPPSRGPPDLPLQEGPASPASDAHSPRLVTFTLTPPPSAFPSSQICSRPSLTFSDFLNDFVWKDEVPLWIWEWENLRLVLMANRAFWVFLRNKEENVILKVTFKRKCD